MLNLNTHVQTQTHTYTHTQSHTQMGPIIWNSSVAFKDNSTGISKLAKSWTCFKMIKDDSIRVYKNDLWIMYGMK